MVYFKYLNSYLHFILPGFNNLSHSSFLVKKQGILLDQPLTVNMASTNGMVCHVLAAVKVHLETAWSHSQYR